MQINLPNFGNYNPNAIVNNPPNITNHPFYEYMRDNKADFLKTDKKMLNAVIEKEQNQDKYMSRLLWGTVLAVGIALYMGRNKIKGLWQSVKNKYNRDTNPLPPPKSQGRFKLACKRVEKAALEGEHTYDLPKPMNDDTFNMSFSGLKSNIINLVHNEQQRGNEIRNNDLARSFQDVAVDELCRKSELAIKKFNVKNMIIAGGVSANKYLRGECKSFVINTM